MKLDNIDPKSLETMLSVVAKKLGKSPDQLKSELQAGKFDKALNNMSPSDTAKVQQAIKNPKLVEAVMSPSQAKNLYEKLKGDQQ